MMQWRDDPKQFHWLFNKQKLGQQYVITESVSIEQREIQQAKKQQDEKRIAPSKDLREAIKKKANLQPGETFGRIYFTPQTVKGTPKYYQKAYADSQAMIREMGEPHLFVTFTGMCF
jgi:Helitron helicase-like domain at N-terminus